RLTSLRELTANRSYNPFGGESSNFVKVRRDDLRCVVWAGAFVVSALATFGLLMLRGYSLPQWWVLLGLALVAGLAERHSVALLGNRQRGIEISVSFVPFVFTAGTLAPSAP